MSITAIEIKRAQRARQIEYGPDSEEFTVVGGGTFRGIFDRSYIYDNKDSGNVQQKKNNPLIMVATIPEELIERTSKIRREEWQIGDKEFTFNGYAIDDEGVPILWLY